MSGYVQIRAPTHLQLLRLGIWKTAASRTMQLEISVAAVPVPPPQPPWRARRAALGQVGVQGAGRDQAGTVAPNERLRSGQGAHALTAVHDGCPATHPVLPIHWLAQEQQGRAFRLSTRPYIAVLLPKVVPSRATPSTIPPAHEETMSESSLFTSESVSDGHPDKVADQISDAILDAFFRAQPDESRLQLRVACETLVKTGMVILAGEYRLDCKAVQPCLEQVARDVLRDIGYVASPQAAFDVGFDADTCVVLNALGPQSNDIAKGVDETTKRKQGAGDQGLMFGYACNDNEDFMPAPIHLAHRLMRRQQEVRKNDLAWLLGPDAKTQVTFHYEDNVPVGVHEIVLSSQHTPISSGHKGGSVTEKMVHEAVREEIIYPCLQAAGYKTDAHILINPAGPFEIGGPVADCGLTGRKIIVDTYGGMARHGGGAFSGKDPSKVDRSASYMARYMAKNLVAAGLATRCEIQISYAIGKAKPRSIRVDTFGTGKISDQLLEKLLRDHFDLSPKQLTETLQLQQPFYQQTATFGHFGRKNSAAGFTWERTDQAEALRQAAEWLRKDS